jgi:signal transduction histidine kinase
MSSTKNNNQNLFRFYSLVGTEILIVEDDPGFSKSLEYYFEDQDCIVYTADCAERGLELLDKFWPDVILVDLNMTGMGGHNFIDSISKSKPDIPIIVISGTGIIEEAIRSIKLGASDFVSKPIQNFEDLKLSVVNVLEKAFLIKENKNYKNNLEKLVEERTIQLQQKNDELQKLIIEYKKAKEKAEETDKLKSEFLGQISHEVRTPLFQIVGYMDLVRAAIEERQFSDTTEYFEKMHIATNRMTRTIDLILHMSEISSGLYDPKFKVFNLEEVIDELVLNFLTSMQSKGVEFIFDCRCKNTNTLIDKYSVDQIINNLIDNAIKFTANGKIVVRLYDEGDKINVEIEDTGIGISKEYMENLYKFFTQEEHGYTRSYEGNGLGLALTKKYCDLNSIDLQIESNKGIGTKVKLKFNRVIG